MNIHLDVSVKLCTPSVNHSTVGLGQKSWDKASWPTASPQTTEVVRKTILSFLPRQQGTASDSLEIFAKSKLQVRAQLPKLGFFCGVRSLSSHVTSKCAPPCPQYITLVKSCYTSDQIAVGTFSSTGFGTIIRRTVVNIYLILCGKVEG